MSLLDTPARMRPLEAYQELMSFAKEYGEGALRLAMHAAVPQGFRSELLHLLRLNFIPESLGGSVLEADVLLAPLCEDMGGGYYQFDPEIRRLLLDSLIEAYMAEPVSRLCQVANFLLQYMEYLEHGTYGKQDPLWQDYLETQRWIALAFLDPDAAAAQLAAALSQIEETSDVVTRIRLGGLPSALSTPLVRHRKLLLYAAALQALETGVGEQGLNILQSLGDEEITVGGITLRPARALRAAWHAQRRAASAPATKPDEAAHVEEVPASPITSTYRARIFIIYKRSISPDEPLALEIVQALRQYHEVFIDQMIPVGVAWGERILEELRQADVVIALLSAASVQSELVVEDVRIAYTLAREHDGRPIILPVRLAYAELLPYQLSAYLNHIEAVSWSSSEDTPRLITELFRAIAEWGTRDFRQDALRAVAAGVQPPLAAAFEMPGGSVAPDSLFYIERAADRVALQAIQRQGATIIIQAPRQMGKSSLLVRVIHMAMQIGKRTVLLDFALLDRATLQNADTFFRFFCSWLSDELEIEDRVDDYWRGPLGNIQRCTRYVQRHLLAALDDPLVLAIDEADTTLDGSVRSDFFSMLRSWHNSRARTSIWGRVDLVLAISTKPWSLISNLHQSPFNVGQSITLEDLTPAEVAELNRRHGSPLSSDEVQQLIALLGGHPYLVRQALYLVASGRLSAPELFAHATDDDGPFSDHLRSWLFRMHNHAELVHGIRQIIRTGTCSDRNILLQLDEAGLVRSEGQRVLPRNQLYASYFRDHL
jgi:hypothetical protein